MTSVCCAFNNLVPGESAPIGHCFEGPGRVWAEQKAAAKLRGPFFDRLDFVGPGVGVPRDHDVGVRRWRQRSAAKALACRAKAFAEGFPRTKTRF
jgi:hypothetical protein